MKRTIEQWKNCDPESMAVNQSAEARAYAFADAKADILELKQERDELAAMVAVKDDALKWYAGDGSAYDGIDIGERARNALSLTDPAAVHEIRAQMLDEACNREELYCVRGHLQAMAAAERAKIKGEE